MIYSFDDSDICLTENGIKMDKRLLARPPGIFRKDWHTFAAAITSLLNEQHKLIVALKEEVRIDDFLLEERKRVLQAIPPCAAHGTDCIPHALEWIETRRKATALTTAQLAEALVCFHNGAMNSAAANHAGGTAREAICAIVEGVNAIATNLLQQADAAKKGGASHEH